MPIFVYRCDCGHRFERLVPRDASAPACPECDGVTRKVPSGPRLGRVAGTPPTRSAAPSRSSVPLPWQGVVNGGPEKLAREVEFRQRLEAKAVGGLRVPGGPDLPSGPDAGGSSNSPAAAE